MSTIFPTEDGFVSKTRGSSFNFIDTTHFLQFGLNYDGTFEDCYTFLRFSIAPGTVIASATLRLFSGFSEDFSDYPLLVPIFLTAINEDNATSPTSYADYIARSTVTSIPLSLQLLGDSGYPTVINSNYSYWELDVKSTIQAVINRPGYGGNVIILLKADISYDDPTFDSCLAAWDMEDATGFDPSAKPTLILTLANAYNETGSGGVVIGGNGSDKPGIVGSGVLGFGGSATVHYTLAPGCFCKPCGTCSITKTTMRKVRSAYRAATSAYCAGIVVCRERL